MPGVALRALAEAHIHAVVEACADWEELAPYGAPYWRPRSPAELQRRIAATAGPSLASEYSLVIVEDGVLIGECSIHAIDWRNRVGEVVVCIWRPAHRGHGRGHDCLRQLMSWATGYLGLHRLEARVLDGNEPSMRLVLSLGFVYEGVLRRRYLDGGRWRDIHMLAYVTDA